MPKSWCVGIQGYEKFMDLCCKTKYDALQCVDFKWWRANVRKRTSCVPLQCIQCGGVSRTTSIESFVRNRTAACWCNGGLHYKSEQGRLRVLSLCTGKIRPTGFMCTSDEWAAKHVNARTKLPLQCSTCSTVSWVSVNNLQKQHSMLCACSSRWKWSTNERRLELLQVFESLNLRPDGRFQALYDQEKWLALQADQGTYIEATCLHCNASVSTTIIASVVNGKVGCLCHYKTERKMVDMLREIANGQGVSVQRQTKVCKSKSGGILRADATLHKAGQLIAIFECDGVQHFKNSFCKSDALFERQVQNDLLKEQMAIAQSIPLVRVPADELCGRQGIPRQRASMGFVRQMAKRAIDGMLRIDVHCQELPCYRSGVYRTLRECV